MMPASTGENDNDNDNDNDNGNDNDDDNDNGDNAGASSGLPTIISSRRKLTSSSKHCSCTR